MKSKNKPLEKEQHDECKSFLNGKTVRLVGESDDENQELVKQNFQCLSKLHIDGARVCEDETDGNYYLKDPIFDEIDDIEEVLRKAENILNALNYDAKARCNNFQPVKIEIGPVCTFEWGERKITNFITTPAVAEINSGGGLQDAHADVKEILEGQKQDRTVRKIQREQDRSVQRTIFILSTTEAIIFFILGNALSTFGFSLQNIMIVTIMIAIIIVVSFIFITWKY